MTLSPRARLARMLLVLVCLFAVNCSTWTRIPSSDPHAPAVVPPTAQPQVVLPAREAAATQLVAQPQVEPAADPLPILDNPQETVFSAGEPAGCLTAAAQDALPDAAAMLTYADSLLNLKGSLSQRLLPNTWNAYTGLFTWEEFGILSLGVGSVENQYYIQRMLNALHVSGFVAWLRSSPQQDLHILAIPLRDFALMESSWTPYIQAYWSSRFDLPAGDPNVLPALKLPPCAWMVERGFAPPVSMDWWASDLTGWPDYAAVASAYLADTTAVAEQVAQGIDWLGSRFPEGPDTMCGPLVWSIMHDARVFPPGWGAWQEGAKTFWLARPEKNGRPWSLFPKDTFSVYHFSEPLGAFDFETFPLYPGDFLYTYAFKDGFDHMLMVTETGADGALYTVSNIVRVEPQVQTTIERALLLDPGDPSLGIARNQWAWDKINGRTGHAGFEVFRWKWMEKDITGQPAAALVEPGDTVGLLAARWKTPSTAIAEYNGITVETPLTVGQVVMIPPIPPGQAGEG